MEYSCLIKIYYRVLITDSNGIWRTFVLVKVLADDKITKIR